MERDGPASALAGDGWQRPGDQTRPTPLSGERLDSVLDALAAGRRRSILQYFRRSAEDVATVRDIADFVAGQTGDGDRERALVALYHQDLPRLADAALVEYDAEIGIVRYLESPFVEALLDRVDDSDGETSTELAGERAAVGALGHLYDALATDDVAEKDYLVRQALQHVYLARDE